MTSSEEIRKRIFQVKGTVDFNDLAIEIFHIQSETNPVYRNFLKYLKVSTGRIKDFHEIPFLPIVFFKDHELISRSTEIQKIFRSSGTTGMKQSKHLVADLALYEESFNRSFTHFYGKPENYRFLALLPGYLERNDSSLAYMLDHFINLTKHHGSGFFLHDTGNLLVRLAERSVSSKQTILFGASYALLDLAEQSPVDISGGIVMETGGMKGRRKEMVREELHEILTRSFHVDEIHSEYGMTELLSQAYSAGNGIFRPPPWMKVLIRDIHDPLSFLPPGKTGGISVIDLANLNSCSFIATQDLGRLYDDGSFEILGRYDDSDVRGCNLLVQ